MQSTLVVSSQGNAAATVVQPTTTVREGLASTPAVASREIPTLVQVLNQTSERQFVALPSVRSETGAAAPQQQRERGARLSTTPREAAQSQVFLAADSPFARSNRRFRNVRWWLGRPLVNASAADLNLGASHSALTNQRRWCSTGKSVGTVCKTLRWLTP